jgi:hypothetical protein
MIGSIVGQKLGTEMLGRIADATDTPDRLVERSLIDEPGRYELVMVFHDADKAGPHVDVHIGQMSLIYRIKPELRSKLTFTRDHILTKESKNFLLNHIRREIDNRTPVPQNLDHSPEQAKFGWVDGGAERNGYGAGSTRQVIHQSLVDVYKIGNAVEFYAPQVNPDSTMYIYRLPSRSDKKTPIVIWGNKAGNTPEFRDRLHLKSLDPDNPEIKDKAIMIDWKTSTAKYDGASTYLVITEKGATAWSPRIAKSTGKRIEYTHKIPGLADVTSDQPIVAMGEILYMDKAGAYLKGPKISGVLNSKEVLPLDIYPQIRLYRVDEIGPIDACELDFWANRALQEMVSELSPNLIKPVELMTPHQAKKAGLEGIVVAPPGKSILSGFKMKWWEDPNDWRIEKIKFERGEKGRIAGVVECVSLDSQKKFKLGATAVGNEYLTKHMMENPDLYEGSVIKVLSRHGHEGRSAKVVGFHDDKGLAPL